jgi:hypothetical protein
MRSTALSALLSVLLLPVALRAQTPEMGIAFSPMNVDFLSGPVAFELEAVPNAPYSAEAVTEMVQTLADGNRIVRETKALVSRDGQGRMRREQGFPLLGAGGGAGTAEIHHVQLSDPAAGTTVMLDYENKIARKMMVPARQWAAGGGINTGGGIMVQMNHFELPVPPPPPPPPPPGMPRAGVQMFSARRVTPADLSQAVTEQLGAQVVQGVTAEGTRTTTTIPAGQIGNERPIQIVSERWYSNELKTLVMSRHSDPRFGETTYRLANLTLGDPPADQFEVPADFQVIDGGNVERDIVIQRK